MKSFDVIVNVSGMGLMLCINTDV